MSSVLDIERGADTSALLDLIDPALWGRLRAAGKLVMYPKSPARGQYGVEFRDRAVRVPGRDGRGMYGYIRYVGLSCREEIAFLIEAVKRELELPVDDTNAPARDLAPKSAARARRPFNEETPRQARILAGLRNEKMEPVDKQPTRPRAPQRGAVLIVLDAASERVKIGSVKESKRGLGYDVKRRLREYQTGNPNNLEVVCVIETDDRYRLEEDVLHVRFDQYRTRGEWFTLDVLEFFPFERAVEIDGDLVAA